MYPQSCDTMVALGAATRHGQTLFAKNSDRPKEECQPLVQRPREEHPAGSLADCAFVAVPQAPVTFRHVGSRPYWCRGYEHGFNEHQVVIGNEGLPSRVVHKTPKLIGMELIRGVRPSRGVERRAHPGGRGAPRALVRRAGTSAGRDRRADDDGAAARPLRRR
jgi:hypothetical protein